MSIKETNVKMLPIGQLVTNDGQIEGVPANPRQINKTDFEKLKASLRANDLTGVMPLKVYPQGEQYVVLGGNMRLRALQELGAAEVSCIVLPENTDVETLREVVIVDNSTFGEWDNDMLADQWDESKLREWGVSVPDFGEDDPKEDKEEEPQVNKSELIIAGVSVFGQTGETIVCEEIAQEDADKLLAYIKANGAQGLIQKMLA